MKCARPVLVSVVAYGVLLGLSGCNQDEQESLDVSLAMVPSSYAVDGAYESAGTSTATNKDEKVIVPVARSLGMVTNADTKADTDTDIDLLSELVIESPIPSSESAEVAEPDHSQISVEEFPYPLYPNGKAYRQGTENGLNVVVFETLDTMMQVEHFYSQMVRLGLLTRLEAMPGYVRYSLDPNDNDPWTADTPGIVVHVLSDDAERLAVGSSESAITNIIMSY